MLPLKFPKPAKQRSGGKIVKEKSATWKKNNSITLNKRAKLNVHIHVYTLVLIKDIVSLRVEVGHISVPCPKVIDWFTVAVEQGGLGRHD
jgi:hypothetical protein